MFSMTLMRAMLGDFDFPALQAAHYILGKFNHLGKARTFRLYSLFILLCIYCMISRSGLLLSVHLHCVLHPVEHVPGHHQRHVQRGQGRDGGGRGKFIHFLHFLCSNLG